MTGGCVRCVFMGALWDGLRLGGEIPAFGGMTGVGVGLVGAAWAGMSGGSCATGSLTGAGGGARLAAG